MHTNEGHIISFSRSTSGHRGALVDFIAEGLRLKEAIYCLSRDHDSDIVLDALREEGFEIDDCLKRKQLVLLSAETLLAEDGALDTERVLHWLDKQRMQKIAEGYPSVRMTIEMSWALERFGQRKIVRFETGLDQFASDGTCRVASRYDLNRCDTGCLLEILRTSRQLEIEGQTLDNLYYAPPDTLLGPSASAVLFHQMVETIEERRKRDTLLDSADILHALFREIDVGFALFEVLDGGLDHGIVYQAIEANPVLEEINGVGPDELIGKSAAEIFPTADAEIIEILGEVSHSGLSARFERFKEDIKRYYEVIAFRPRQGLCAALVTDITDRKRMEENKQRTEFRIRQTQKMEAIGRLASGVAHDFNNILTAIVGLTNVLMEEIPEDWPQWQDLEEIRKAADRAAALTRQLLAFSRKQEIAPKVINLNQTIADSHRMLSRIMGEDVRLIFKPESQLKLVKIDPGQLEQILANFTANARDALPSGGELSLETRNETIVEHKLTKHGEVPIGDYVVLTARDNGIGMTDAVLERIFEPFFTTKEKGKGTGLGLATVYGITRQNNGSILVSSKPGEGTCFEIYLPVVDTAASHLEESAPVKEGRGTGTILLVEDEGTVRNLTMRILERYGYSVIAAANGEEAVALFKKRAPEIDLLLTDVIMPGMNGVALFNLLQEKKRGLQVLYMSGYSEDVIHEHGMETDAVTLLEKPFAPDVMVRRIREILEGYPDEDDEIT